MEKYNGQKVLLAYLWYTEVILKFQGVLQKE